jgi:hypothetical protein
MPLPPSEGELFSLLTFDREKLTFSLSNVRGKLAVSKQRTKGFHIGRCILQKFNDILDKEP